MHAMASCRLSSLLAAAFVAALTTTTLSAHAEDAPEATPKSQSSYGYQTLVADGTALAMLAASAVTTGTFSDLLADGAVSGYVLAPATLHIVHGHIAKGVGDVAVRVFMPAAFGAVASLATHPRSSLAETKDTPAVMGGLLGGAAVASAIDALVLAKESTPPPASVATSALTPAGGDSVTVRPTLSTKADGFSAGIAGTF
jgi:hypothetical protein